MKSRPDFFHASVPEFESGGGGSFPPSGLLRAFESERLLRQRAGCEPSALFIDSDDDRLNLRLLVERGDQSSMVVIGAGSCISGNGCSAAGRAGITEICDLVPTDLGKVDLVLCRIDFSALQSGASSCLLGQLRDKTRTGGMLYAFCSDPAALQAERPSTSPTTRLASGRRLFNALVGSGWSVLRASHDAGGVSTAVAARS